MRWALIFVIGVVVPLVAFAQLRTDVDANASTSCSALFDTEFCDCVVNTMQAQLPDMAEREAAYADFMGQRDAEAKLQALKAPDRIARARAASFVTFRQCSKSKP